MYCCFYSIQECIASVFDDSRTESHFQSLPLQRHLRRRLDGRSRHHGHSHRHIRIQERLADQFFPRKLQKIISAQKNKVLLFLSILTLTYVCSYFRSRLFRLIEFFWIKTRSTQMRRWMKTPSVLQLSFELRTDRVLVTSDSCLRRCVTIACTASTSGSI